MKSAVIVFPGSNCDHDMLHALTVLGHDAHFIWHKETSLVDFDMVVLPGGFSYGDYLRPGAIAKFSPIMKEVVAFAARGKPVLGICNGFQMLVETGLLPGALLRNERLRFSCKYVYLRAENRESIFTRSIPEGELLKIPIAHGDGRYFVTEDIYQGLLDKNQIAFRYVNAQGEVESLANPNGSIGNIAGVINEVGNVLGMMPHPERAVETLLGSADGRRVFESLSA